ncbi:MAG: translocation/assembly module TamB domain-containing protein [Gammaproteobacteria bacterium]
MKLKGIIGGLIWTILSVPFVIISLTSFLTFSLYTDYGKKYILAKIEQIVESRTGYVVEIQDFQNDLFSDFLIKSLVVADKHHKIISLQNVRVVWSKKELLQLKFKINQLKIQNIDLLNKPDQLDRESKGRSFSIGSIQWPIEIEQLEISALHIEPNVLGQAAYDASVLAQLNLISGEVTLDLKTVKGPSTQLMISGKRAADALQLDIVGQEGADGMIAAWLGMNTDGKESNISANVIVNSIQSEYQLNIAKMKASIASHQFELSGQSAFTSDFQTIRFTDLNLVIDQGSVAGTGYYEKDYFAISTTIKNLPTDFFKIAHFPVKKGYLNGEIQAKGTLANPSVTLDLVLDGVAEIDQKIKAFDATMALQGSVQSKKITVDAKISNRTRQLGSLSLKLPWPDFPFSSKQQKLIGLMKLDFELEPVFSLLPYVDHQLKGHVTGDLKLAGYYSKPTFKGQFKIQDGDYQYTEKNLQIQNIELDALFLDKGEIEVTHFRANAGTGEIEGHGRYTQDRQSISLTLKRLPTSLFAIAELPLKESILDGTLSYQGTFEDPTLRAELRMSGLYAYDDINNKVPLDLNFSANLENQLIRLKTNIHSESDSIGDIVLIANWNRLRDYRDQTADLGEAHLNVELSSIGSILKLDQQKISGSLESDLIFKGNLLSPSVNGRITLKQGQYQHIKAGIALQDISLIATAHSNKINIDTLSALDDREGTIQLAGAIEWPNRVPYIILRGYLNDMHLINTPQMSGDLKGPVELKGELNHLLLSGDLQLSPLEIDLDRNTSAIIPEITVITREAYQKKFERQSSSAKIIEYNINIKAPRRIFISGNGLEAELEGNLKITGNNQKPLVEGSLTTIRGQYEFLNKKFKITSGKIWIERNKLILDISATTKASNLVATVNIRGATDDIQFSMSSNPALPQDEIISKILFGRDIKRLSPFQAVQLANALGNLSKSQRKTVDLGILNKTKKLLQVDTFSLDANEKSEVTVGVGKYLTDDAYIQLQQGTTTQQTQAIVEIELTPSISLESTTNAADTTVGDLKIIWRHDY